MDRWQHIWVHNHLRACEGDKPLNRDSYKSSRGVSLLEAHYTYREGAPNMSYLIMNISHYYSGLSWDPYWLWGAQLYGGLERKRVATLKKWKSELMLSHDRQKISHHGIEKMSCGRKWHLLDRKYGLIVWKYQTVVWKYQMAVRKYQMLVRKCHTVVRKCPIVHS